MATPLAAGAYAILSGAFPSASVDQIEKAFHDSGVAVTEPVSKKKLTAIQLAQAYKEMSGHQPVTIGAKTTTPAVLGQASEQSKPTSATRFIIEIPGGNAAEKQSVLQRSLSTFSASLDAGRVGVSPIGPNALSLTTEKPIDPAALKDKLQLDLGGVGTVTPDLALPPTNDTTAR
jgi:hypothetical protein